MDLHRPYNIGKSCIGYRHTLLVLYGYEIRTLGQTRSWKDMEDILSIVEIDNIKYLITNI